MAVVAMGVIARSMVKQLADFGWCRWCSAGDSCGAGPKVEELDEKWQGLQTDSKTICLSGKLLCVQREAYLDLLEQESLLRAVHGILLVWKAKKQYGRLR